MAQLKLSLLASVDDLHRCTNSLLNADTQCEAEFLKFVTAVEQLWTEWSVAVGECRRLQQALHQSHQSNAKLTAYLASSRKLLDAERKACKDAEREKRAAEVQLAMIRDILCDQKNKLHEDAKEKLSFISQALDKVHPNGLSNGISDRLDTIAELDSTGSLLSEFSYSRSEDDLDGSFLDTRKDFKKCHPAPDDIEPSPKRRRSSIRKSLEVRRSDINSEDRVVATTTVTVRREGNITAHSEIKATPHGRSKGVSDLYPTAPPISIVTDSNNTDSSPSNNNNWATPRNAKLSMPPPSSASRATLDISPSFGMNRKNINTRPHTFVTKTTICPETCNYCSKRLKFGKQQSKCQDCRALCHVECESLLPLPCIPVGNTPAVKGSMGTIADYTPMTSPMIPSLIVHCIREIEDRGLNEVGIYRVPGSERDVKALKESFLRGKGAPNLTNVDIHVLCGAVKDFLRSLREPLILRTSWHRFVQAAEMPVPEDAHAELVQAISELPQPNRDTLAALILHLQRVADCKECKMPIGNLSKIFGPTIVGYSTAEPEAEVMLSETKKQAMVVDQLMRMPSDYWANFATPCGSENRDVPLLSHNPSTGSLLSGARNFLGTTPRSVRGKKRFFATPPAYK